MSDYTIHTLVPSTSQGRYALDDPVSGQDITSGQPLLILLGGHWLKGSIEHAGGLYALEQAAHPVSSGYYFLAQRWQRVRFLRRHESPKQVKGGNSSETALATTYGGRGSLLNRSG